ncbi:uncharacterized protein LOC126199388 [Schistocerca nitens]|uniref:uncharacterized protein LOC126199388 n=1 Tax=Schistocerca nitens TaxID=7011 RepID=UPI0021184C7F|nr:uncharacterized protein LOC126199388 [Schistocerca nitens]
MKLCPLQFIPDEPELWLAMLDLIFHHHGIVIEETKFMIAVSALDNKTAIISAHIILKPLAVQKYMRFKQLLIERLHRPVEQRIQQVLDSEKRGDKSPSEFWQHLRSLVNDTKLPVTTLQHVWQVQLPEVVRTAVVLLDAQDMSSLISLANKVYTSDAVHMLTVMF